MICRRKRKDVDVECLKMNKEKKKLILLTTFINKLELRQHIINGNITKFIRLVEFEVKEQFPVLTNNRRSPIHRVIIRMLRFLDMMSTSKLDIFPLSDFSHNSFYDRDFPIVYCCLRHYISLDKTCPWMRETIRNQFLKLTIINGNISKQDFDNEIRLISDELLYSVHDADISFYTRLLSVDTKYQLGMKEIIKKMRLELC